MFVRVSDPPVVLFLKIVFRQIRVAAAPQPELLDELFALFAGAQLQKRRALFRRDNVDHVFAQPLFVLGIQLFQRAAHFLFLFFSQLLRGCRSGRTRRFLLRHCRCQRNHDRECGRK